MKVNAIELMSAEGAPARMNGFEVDSQEIEILGNNPTVTSLKESLRTIIPQPNLGNIKVLSLPVVAGGSAMWDIRGVNDALMAGETYGFINLGKPPQAAVGPPPMKKARPTVLEDTQIKAGLTVKLQIQKLSILSPKKKEAILYYGREGMDKLFSDLVNSKEDKAVFNVTLLGHPGAGKRNLVWAVAHHVVVKSKVTVLWASRRDEQETWTLRLFEWCGDKAQIFELDDFPPKLRDILNDPLLEDLCVLILDAPTCAKSTNPLAADGVAAFEWAGKESRIRKRRMIHTSSLWAYSLDERILDQFNLENKVMRPWTRKDFIDSLSDNELKRQVCETVGLDPTENTAEDIVDAKLYYSGINARWFFNFTIEQIKKICQGVLERMSHESFTAGIGHERAVNSAYVTTWDGTREIKLFTSRHLAGLLSAHNDHAKQFFELYPMMKGRLGNGAPGEIFEADFLVNLEQSHAIAAAQRYVMGEEKAEKVAVAIGKDSTSGETVRWLTGKLTPLPKNPRKKGAQPMPFTNSTVNRVPQWLVPNDHNQPFLDFLALFPVPDGKWELRVIQNTVSGRYSTDLDQLQRVMIGVENAGFVLASTVKVCLSSKRTNRLLSGLP